MKRHQTGWKILTALLFTHLSVSAAAQGAGYSHPYHGTPPQPHGQSWGAASEQRVKLGIAFKTLSPQDLDQRALEYGLLVKRVMPGSVAEHAGLQPGDSP